MVTKLPRESSNVKKAKCKESEMDVQERYTAGETPDCICFLGSLCTISFNVCNFKRWIPILPLFLNEETSLN